MKRVIVFIVTFLAIISCSKWGEGLEKQIEDKAPANPHLISKAYALASLNQFLGQSSHPTKSVGEESQISVIKQSDLSQEAIASQDSIAPNELVYLVSFSCDNGYAILAADDRIGDDIIAVVDHGSVTKNEMIESYRNSDVEAFDPGLIHKLCLDYALNSIDLSDTLDVTEPENNDIIEEYVVRTETITYKSVSPKLTLEVDWSQTSPFNDYCNYRSGYSDNNLPANPYDNGRNYVGCVPLAVAKIMAYFEWPTYLEINGYLINWYALKYDLYSDNGKRTAATLLRHIGKECNSMYFDEGTFTLPSEARKYLSDMLYPNVKLVDYSTDAVIYSLDNDCPLFICSLPHNGFLNYDFASSHAWNIDGYKESYKEITKYIFVNGEYSHEVVEHANYTTKVHCDFGWEGLHNGYYTSGVFKLRGNDIEYDEPKKIDPSTTNYNYYLKLITYDKPY